MVHSPNFSRSEFGPLSSSAATGGVLPFGRGVIAAVAALAMVISFAGPAAAAIPTAPASSQATIGLLGARPGQTALPIPISDRVSANVDVATGNLNVSVGALALPDVNGSTGIGLVFNSRAENTAPTNVPARWSLSIGSAATLSQVSNGVLYTGGDGYSTVFTSVNGSTTAFTPPAGVKADLVKTTTGYTLTSRTTSEVTTFNTDGKTTGMADRNGNTTTIAYTGPGPASVTSTAGPLEARTATFGYDSGGSITTISQSSAGMTRKATIDTDPYEGTLTGFTDSAGKETKFEYVNQRISSVITPTGARTNFTYDTAGKLTQVEKVNQSAGSPGNSVTRIAYPSATQTLVAGPNTNLASAVTAVPRTTYTIAANKTVTAVTDPMGRAQSTTYTGDFDTLTATQGSGTTAGTTTNTYGSNTGQSLTASKSSGGATGQAEYANTAASTKYLASSTTDDSGSKSLYTYNGAGNAMSSTDALAAEAKLTYNTDGTVATALAPGNGANATRYAYDATTKQLASTTPVTGSSLGVRNFTYDAFGQPKTATNGRGVTLTYAYDVLGRLTGTSFSDGTPTVSFTYNDDGQTLTRVDGQGTTSYGYDQMGRLTSRSNTAGGGTITYGYDKASNLTSTTDSRGTTTYTFDASGTPTELIYLNEGTPQTLAFATDDRGRRTDTWLQANPDRTTWAAHTKTEYDTTGRVTRVIGEQGSGNTSNTKVVDLSYCYSAGSTAPTCPTTAAQDRSKIQWVKDNLTGAVTNYTYDGAGRLTNAVVTGGPAPTTYTYTYDARGNRLTSGGGTTPATNFTFNPANQITTAGYTFDGTGNLTAAPGQTFTYSGADQMLASGKNGNQYTKTYAGTTQNEMLTQKSQGGNYDFVYGRTDAQGLPIIEQVERDNSTAYVEHAPVTGAPLILRTSSGLASLYIFDGTGNPAALITSGSYTAFAYTYDPYGVPTLTKDSGGNGKPQNPYTFKQGLQDRSTGWVKYGARWYDPTTGRWTQQDTLDAPLDPLNANRYAFAANDPINNSDPLGLATCQFDSSCDGTPYNGNFGSSVPGASYSDLSGNPGNTFGCRLSYVSYALGPLAFTRIGAVATTRYALYRGIPGSQAASNAIGGGAFLGTSLCLSGL